MKRFAIVAAMFAAACGYSEDKFADELAEAGCTYVVNCVEAAGFADVDACLAAGEDVEVEETECLNFDSDAAQACVEAYQAAADSCPEAGPSLTVCGDVCDIEADTGMDTEADSDSDTAAM